MEFLAIVGPVILVLVAIGHQRRKARVEKVEDPLAAFDAWHKAAPRLEISLHSDLALRAEAEEADESETLERVIQTPDAPVMQTLLPEFSQFLALDVVDGGLPVTEAHLAKWGVDFETAMSEAKDNLEMRASHYRFAHLDAVIELAIYRLQPQRDVPGFDASLILSEKIRELVTKRFGPDVIALIPDRASLFVTELTEESLPVAAEIARMLYDGAKTPLYPAPIVWREEGELYAVVPSEPPDEPGGEPNEDPATET